MQTAYPDAETPATRRRGKEGEAQHPPPDHRRGGGACPPADAARVKRTTARHLGKPPVLASCIPMVLAPGAVDVLTAYCQEHPEPHVQGGPGAWEAWGKAIAGGRILPSHWTRGPGGRIMAGGPLMQVIPGRLRHLFEAPAGHTLVDLDWANAHATIASVAHGDGEAMRRAYSSASRDRIARILGITPGEAKRTLIAWLTGGSLTEYPALRAWLRRRCPRYAGILDSTRAVPRAQRHVLTRWDAHTILTTGYDPDRSWRSLLALRLQAAEARALDDVLLTLPDVEGARLALPMYDGLVVALPCAPDEVRSHPATRSIVRAMRRASRERWGITGGVKVRWGETWAMGAGEVVVPGDP